MLVSEIKNINDLYKAENVYDNPYTAICDVCLIEKPLIEKYWNKSNLKFIKKKIFCRYYCKSCTTFYKSKIYKDFKKSHTY